MRFSHLIGLLLCVVMGLPTVCGQEADMPPEAEFDSNDIRIRGRYVQVLERNPFQDRAFNSVYEAYFAMEGVDHWIEDLEARGVDSPTRYSDLILLGRIHARQFKVEQAIGLLEQAQDRGAGGADFDIFLGTLYYDSGSYEGAAELLTRSLESLNDPERRGKIARILGNVYLRQGDKDQAVAAWKRIAEQDADDVFALLELAEIYGDNAMWQEAIDAHEKVIAASPRDIYRRCQSLRTIARANIQLENFPQAVAKYEEAMELVSPGNWLFEELRRNLVTIYQDLGDMDGLLAYLEGKLEQDPGSIDYRLMKAEAYFGMSRYVDSEATLREIIERAPAHELTHEKLLVLYKRTRDRTRAKEVFESLIELYPANSDYVRRLGEEHLADEEPTLAKETWSRWADDAEPERLAQVAKWLERYDFLEEAADTYARAVEAQRLPEWLLRLAALRFELGSREDALGIWMSMLDEGRSSAEQHAEIAAILVTYAILDEAEQIYRTAAEKDPENLDFSLKLARLLVGQDRYEEALAFYTALAEQQDQDYFRRKGEQGQLKAYSALGRIVEVQAAWKAAADAEPESVEPALRLARLYEHVGNRPSAIAIYEKAAVLEPGVPSHLVRLALLYSSTRLPDKAIETYKILIDTDRNRAASYHRALMQIFQSQNRQGEATIAAQQVVALSPASAEARVTLAELYMMYNRPEDALQQYRNAVRLEPEDPSYLRKYGVALASQKRWGEAAESYRKMLSTAGGTQTRLDAVELLAQVHVQEGRQEELAQEFNRRVQNTPRRLSAYEELAAVYRAIGDVSRAVETMERAISATEDKEAALRRLLAEAHDAGQLDKVVLAYTQLIALSGRPTVVELERLGDVYAQMGDLERARETWERISVEYPDDSEAFLAQAKAFRSQGFVEQAIEAKERAIELKPYNYSVRFDLANDWSSHGQLDKGLAHLEKLLELGAPPDEEESTKLSPDMLGLVMASEGRNQSAWNGTFSEFRPRVLSGIVDVGRRGGTLDALFERYQDRSDAREWDLSAKEDLLDMYETANRWGAAVDVAEALVAARPADSELLIRTAALYQRTQDLDTAKGTTQSAAKAGSGETASQKVLRIRTHIANGETDAAADLIGTLVRENAVDTSVLLQADSLFQESKTLDQIRATYDSIIVRDPSLKPHIQMQLVGLYRKKGYSKEARRLYSEIIFSREPVSGGRHRPQPQGFIYSPEIERGYWNHNVSAILGRVNAKVDFARAQAFTDVMSMSIDVKSILPIVERLEAFVKQYAQLEPGDEKDHVMELCKMLLAYHTSNEKFDVSFELLETLKAGGGSEDEDLLNFALFFFDRSRNFKSMLPLYDTLEKLHPDLTEQIQRARLNVHILTEDYEEASEIIKRLS